MRRWGRALFSAVVPALALLTACALLLVTAAVATAEPPPPNPSDDDLRASRGTVSTRSAEVGRITAQLADLDARTDELQAALAVQRENAEAAYVELQAARVAAVQAQDQADAAKVATQAATTAIDTARARLDEFVTATYQQSSDFGPLGLLTGSASPDELVRRAELGNLIAQTQRGIQQQLERAWAEKANADSAARAALEEAQRRRQAAATAKAAADAAFATADSAARESAAQLATVANQRAELQSRLDAAVAADAGLRDQRTRYLAWQEEQARAAAARERAARDAATARIAAGGGGLAVGGGVQRVIDRAMSQIGVQYVWGGGNGRGPSTGIPDGLGSPLDRIGFDCSGLMLYAFNGVGVSLPRVSRNQFNAGRKVPISDLRPGDMVFFKNGGAPIHHVAMYVGDGKMIEAPYTGARVRVVPLRTKGLVPQATRML